MGTSAETSDNWFRRPLPKRRRTIGQGNDSNSQLDFGWNNIAVARVSKTQRLGHLLSILPLTTTTTATIPPQSGSDSMSQPRNHGQLIDYRVSYEVSAWLAWKDLQRMIGSSYRPDRSRRDIAEEVDTVSTLILPQLQSRLASCDLDISLEMHDSQFTPMYAAKQLVDILLHGELPSSSSSSTTATTNDTQWGTTNSNQITNSTASTTTTTPTTTLIPIQPMALLGAARSSVTETLSRVAGPWVSLPQISASSTAAALDDKTFYPTLARTVATNQGDAAALVAYLNEYLHVEHFAILFVISDNANGGFAQDDLGPSFRSALQREAELRLMRVTSVPYPYDIQNGDETSVAATRDAMQQIRSSQARFIIGIWNSDPVHFISVTRYAAEAGIMGVHGYTWFLTESVLELLDPSFGLDRTTTPMDVVQALNGVGIVSLYIPTNDRFEQALKEWGNNTAWQQEYISQHADPSLFDNYTFVMYNSDDHTNSLYFYLAFDAVMTIGLAACEVENDLFLGEDLYQQFLRTNFVGVSGSVAFDPATGTRKSDDLTYRMDNLILSDARSTSNTIRFQSTRTALIHTKHAVNADAAGSDARVWSHIDVLDQFVYANNMTVPPDDLSRLSQNHMHLISPAARAVGLCLSAIVMLTSIGWLIWTFRERKNDVVRASQPIFLCLLCLGTLVMSSSIIPMSFQEPLSSQTLDQACMAIPWLFCLGFVTSFSALFSKLWRLNKLFRNGKIMRRIIIRSQDVVKPMVILLSTEIGILIIWTSVSPMIWTRVYVESYGEQQQQSYGTCTAQDGYLRFLVPILCIDLAALLFATYQAYLARNLPTDFSESGYVSISNFAMLEIIVFGIPLLALGTNIPTSTFLIRSFLVAFLCLAILLPIFVPKFVMRNISRRLQEQALADEIAAAAAPIVETELPHHIHQSASRGPSMVSRVSDTSRVSVRRPGGGGVHISISDTRSAGDGNRRTMMSQFYKSSLSILRLNTQGEPPAVGTSRIRRTQNYYRQQQLRSNRRFIPWPSTTSRSTPSSTATINEEEHVQQQQLQDQQDFLPVQSTVTTTALPKGDVGSNPTVSMFMAHPLVLDYPIDEEESSERPD